MNLISNWSALEVHAENVKELTRHGWMKIPGISKSHRQPGSGGCRSGIGASLFRAVDVFE